MEARGVTQMKNVLKGLVINMVFVLAVLPDVGLGITVEAFKGMLDHGDEVTIIDIRPRVSYTEGHIPGAINIPAGIIARKLLPPIGRVIVCGDGIDKGEALEAVRTLNEKAGIQADLLEGGFAAWEALNLPSTKRRGVKRERFRYITYQELKKASANNRDIVLVDIRSSGEVERHTASELPALSVEGLSDLSEKFPGVEIVTLDRRDLGSDSKAGDISIAALTGIKASRHNRVYVLIDRGDGKAEKVARRLHAAGIKQVVILVGGERILQREGRSGLKTIESRN